MTSIESHLGTLGIGLPPLGAATPIVDIFAGSPAAVEALLEVLA